MSIELKIKAATLSAEAKIIARVERKLKKMRDHRVRVGSTMSKPASEGGARIRLSRDVPGTNPLGYAGWGNEKLRSLQAHRRKIVGTEARHTHLARMFLKGTPYLAAERTCRLEPTWAAVQKMAERYASYRKMSEEPSARGPRKFASVQDLAQRFEEWKQADLA